MEKIKNRVVKTYETGKTIGENLEHLVQAISLLIVVGLGIYAVIELPLHWLVRDVCIAALVVIGLRAAYEFFKYFDFKRGK
jgi:hypothetical protein